MTTIHAVVHDRRIDVPAPVDLPDGTQVLLTIEPDARDDGRPMSPIEIARVLMAMQTLEPLDIPEDVAADLDQWERKLNDHGIYRGERGMDEVFE